MPGLTYKTYTIVGSAAGLVVKSVAHARNSYTLVINTRGYNGSLPSTSPRPPKLTSVDFNQQSRGPTPPMGDKFGQYFLGLPRELRDLVYKYFVPRDGITRLLDSGVPPGWEHSSIASELLEADFTYNKFVVMFPDPNKSNESIKPASIWGHHLEYRKFIRHLDVQATEVRLAPTDLEDLEKQCTVLRPEVRIHWAELLEIPHLETLTINMQKEVPNRFSWADFSPILYELRSKLPSLKIRFNISFDNLLKYHWDSPAWNWSSDVYEPYQPMGYIDVSNLIAPPNDKDREYVETYVPQRNNITRGRDVVEGLLAESVADRITLGKYYVTRDPDLVRVLMEEHWGIYKDLKQKSLVRSELEGSD